MELHGRHDGGARSGTADAGLRQIRSISLFSPGLLNGTPRESAKRTRLEADTIGSARTGILSRVSAAFEREISTRRRAASS